MIAVKQQQQQQLQKKKNKTRGGRRRRLGEGHDSERQADRCETDRWRDTCCCITHRNNSVDIQMENIDNGEPAEAAAGMQIKKRRHREILAGVRTFYRHTLKTT